VARLNVSRMTQQELLNLEAKLQKAIPVARERESAKVKREIAALVEKRGFTLSELFGRRTARKLFAPKYANPNDPLEVWNGRGRRPDWLVAKINRGAKLAQFAL